MLDVKKSPKASLEDKKFIYLLVGFVLALSLVYIAFEWTNKEITVYEDVDTDFVFEEELDGAYYAEVRELCGKVCRHRFPPVKAEEITATARADKKNTGGEIVVMLPTGGGNVEEKRVTPDEFERRLNRCLSVL